MGERVAAPGPSFRDQALANAIQALRFALGRTPLDRKEAIVAAIRAVERAR